MINNILPRFLKTTYRKEPISSFIVIVGAVDAVIGGVGERWTLLSFGVVMILLAAAVRWLQGQKNNPEITTQVSRQMLPPSSVPTPLPTLKHPSRYK